jgi:hypothetical protein
MEPTIQLFSKWKTKHAGLFTFAHSPKHISLYHKFGFWPYFLTAIMSKDVSPTRNKNNKGSGKLNWSKYSEVSKEEKEEENYLLNTCRRLTSDIYDVLDLSFEIMSVMKQRLGDIVLVWMQITNMTVRRNLPRSEYLIAAKGPKLAVINATSNLLQSSHQEQMMMLR